VTCLSLWISTHAVLSATVSFQHPVCGTYGCRQEDGDIKSKWRRQSDESIRRGWEEWTEWQTVTAGVLILSWPTSDGVTLCWSGVNVFGCKKIFFPHLYGFSHFMTCCNISQKCTGSVLVVLCFIRKMYCSLSHSIDKIYWGRDWGIILLLPQTHCFSLFMWAIHSHQLCSLPHFLLTI